MPELFDEFLLSLRYERKIPVHSLQVKQYESERMFVCMQQNMYFNIV